MEYRHFKEIQSMEPGIAVTITVRTHSRADPKNKQDRIILKNQIQHAKDRLLDEYDKRTVLPIIEQLDKIEFDFDHDHNTDGLAIFVSADFAEYIRLPFVTTNKVKIAQKFATRELLRATNHSSHYYVLCLSFTEVRLIEAYNDTLLREIKDGFFPFENEEYYTTDTLKNSFGDTNEKYVKEFFGIAYKKFKEYYLVNPLPVVIAATEKNIAFFLDRTKEVASVVGSVRGNFDTKERTSLHELIKQTNVVVHEAESKRYIAALEEMEAAEGANRLLTDLVQVYKALQEGKISRMYVEEDYFQPAILLENNGLKLVDNPEGVDVVDDIINDAIYKCLQLGGDVVFLPAHYMGPNTKIAAIQRW